MKSVEESIEALSRAMMSEARAEAEVIKADAQAKADAIRQQAQIQAASERAEILDRARQDADRLHGQVIATTQMKARTTELEHREKLLQDVFTQALGELNTVTGWTDYQATALRLAREAIAQLGAGKVKIRADEATQKAFSSETLEKLSADLKVQITLAEPLKKGTGVIAETLDGHLQFDNTLETRLARLQSSLRSPVYKILIGEKV